MGLPDMDGLDVLKQLRRRQPDLPVLVLTARSSLDDKVIGLDGGADDYLAKPFEMPELLARLRVLNRRIGKAASYVLSIGAVSLDTTTRQVAVGDNILELSRREYMLLKALMENPGRVQTREQLDRKLYAWGEEVASNAVEVHVHHLRKKLGSGFIQTVHGVGYTVDAN
jgi:DNA-binding response OmpR family regulator